MIQILLQEKQASLLFYNYTILNFLNSFIFFKNKPVRYNGKWC